jgi:hypothetical protein
MSMNVPIGTRSVIQHRLLGELTVDLKHERKRPIYPKGALEAEQLDGEIRGTWGDGGWSRQGHSDVLS